MDVGDWLRSLGLERYDQAFRDNEIDLDLLPNLTGDDSRTLASPSSAIVVGCSTRSPPCEARPRQTNRPCGGA